MRVIFNDNGKYFVSEIVSVNVTDCIEVKINPDNIESITINTAEGTRIGVNPTEINNITYNFDAVLDLTDSNNDKIYFVCSNIEEANAIALELYSKGKYSFINHREPVFYYPDESDIVGIEEAQLKYLDPMLNFN